MKADRYRIKIEEIETSLNADEHNFPTYTRQLINLANQNSGGTKAKVVGQLSELFPQFKHEIQKENLSIKDWKDWYTNKMPNSKDDAVLHIKNHIDLLKSAINEVDEKMICDWVDELLFDKTFIGMQAQLFILEKVAKLEGTKNFRLANPDEESQNIDGYVNDVPYQIKPDTYDFKKYQIKGTIPCKIIKYKKESNSITFEYVQ